MIKGEKMSDKKSEGLGVLWRIIQPVKKYIYSAMFLNALSSIATIITLLTLSLLVAILMNGKNEGLLLLGQVWTFKGCLIVIGGVGMSSFLLSSIAFSVSHLGAFKLEVILRSRIAEHMARIPLGRIITKGTGVLKKVTLDDVKSLHTFVADSTPTIGRSYTGPVISMIVMFFIDWRLALIAISILILGVFMMSFAMKDSSEIQKEYDRGLGRINAAVIEFIQAMIVVRTFDDGTSSFKRYNGSLNSFRDIFIRWMKESGKSARISMMILSPLPTLIGVISGGIIFVSNGSLSLPTLIAMLFLSTAMVDAFMPIMWLNNFIRKSKAAAKNIEDILNIKPMSFVLNGDIPKEMTLDFNNVDFTYDNRVEKALDNISFQVEPGTTTALVGPSGSGKSTIAKLLPRFWDIDKGSICIGGIDIRNMTHENLMDTITYVFQDTYLFNDTLENNIKMGKPEASYEEMIEATKAAQIHGFITSLPQGYNTRAGDRGTRLSGGQRQRITIARAILRDTPIIILDEATAFADPQSEEEIIKAIAHLTQNKSVITIAHRLSTITNVDQILVLDKGKIVEQGKHNDLLKLNGLYAGLWSNYEQAQTWDLHMKGAVHA